MALVEAEYLGDAVLLPETSGNHRMKNSEERYMMPSMIPVYQQQQQMQDTRMLHSFGAIGASSGPLPSVYQFPSIVMASCGGVHAADTELNPNMWSICENPPRKRLRESAPLGNPNTSGSGVVPNTNYHHHTATTPSNMLFSQHSSATCMPSTGLRLSLEDVKPNPRIDLNNIMLPGATAGSPAPPPVSHKLAVEMQRHKNDVDDFVKSQGERLKQILQEKNERHTKAILCAAAETVGRHLREKDIQVLNVKRRNMELENHVRRLLMESRDWESKAKLSDSLVRALRTQVDEKSKEGSGDSEEEALSCQRTTTDGEMMLLMEKSNSNSNRVMVRELELQGRCRVCRVNDVSILLMPCRHLCVCNACENKVDLCPVCACSKATSFQVYLS